MIYMLLSSWTVLYWNFHHGQTLQRLIQQEYTNSNKRRAQNTVNIKGSKCVENNALESTAVSQKRWKHQQKNVRMEIAKGPANNLWLNSFWRKFESLIKNIEFCNVSYTFHEQLVNDIKQIKCTNKAIAPAERQTRNLNKVRDLYTWENVTKTSANWKVNEVDLDAKNIACKLLKSDRFDQLQKHNPSSRHINTSKPDIGKVSKTTLDQVNKEITSSIQANQWKNSSAVMKLFRNIENKSRTRLSRTFTR